MKYKDKHINKLARSMSKILGGTSLAILIASSTYANAAKPLINDSHQVQKYVGAELMDTVSPESFAGDIRDLDLVADWQPGDAIKSIPRRIYPNANKSPLQTAINAVTGNDNHLVELQRSAEGLYSRAVTDGAVNIDGNGYTGVNPADPTGTLGKNYYIQAINGNAGAIFSIYEKSTGNKVAGPTAMSSLATNVCKSALGDPIVFYDETAERYVMTEFSNESGRSLCVYVSKTDNPLTGGWFAYEFQAPEFPDYPKFGRWGDSYYVGTNENAGPGIYALERNKMLLGQSAKMQRKTAPKLAGLSFQMMLPVDVDTVTGPDANSPALFIRQNDDEINNKGSNNASQDYIELWSFAPDYANSANSALTGPIKIAISEFDTDVCTGGAVGFGCLTQKGSTKKLDPVREVVMYRAQYRKFADHESIVGNFVHDTGSDRAGLRWFELRKVTTGSWTLYQEGTYAPSGSDNRFMGSAAMDKSGNIALAYHISGVDTYPSINMTGRLAGDTKGTMTQAEKVLVAGTSHIESDRNGDYSHLALDPVDGCTFWMTSDYGKTNGQWGTRIASFKFAECGSAQSADFALQATNLTQQVCANTSLQPIAITTSATGGFNKAINLSYNNLTTGITGTFSSNPVAIGASSNALVSVGNINSGAYNFNINGAATGASNKQLNVALTVANKPSGVSLTAPSAGAINTELRPTFNWATDSAATSYLVEVATDSAFTNKVATGTVANGTNYQPSADLNANTTYYWRVRADNGCGQVWSSTASFTTKDTSNLSTLTKGVAKNNLSGAANSATNFTFDVPAGASNLTFKMSGGTGDADLYVQFGQEATTSTYQCRPYLSGNNETCTISNVQTGTYHVLIQGYQTYSGVSLVADYTEQATGGGNSLDLTNLSGASNSQTFYQVDVLANANTLTVEISGGTGDVDLYLLNGSKPSESDYSCRPYLSGNNEKCTINSPASGTWHIGLFGYQNYAGVHLTAVAN